VIRSLLVLGVALIGPALAMAKGGLQLEGTLSQAEIVGDALLLRFTGTLSLTVENSPLGGGKPRASGLAARVERLPIVVPEWSEVESDRGEKNPQPSFDEVTALARALARSGHRIRAALDDPELLFSNTGEVTRARGMRLFLHDLDTVAPPAEHESR